MRLFMFLALMSVGISLLAQKEIDKTIKVHGWEVSNEKLAWSKIYFAGSSHVKDFTKGLEFLAKSSKALNLSEKDAQSMVGTFSNLSLKFEEFGYSLIDTPFLISRARHSGNIDVEIKEGRYKVTITDVVSFLNTTQKKGSVYKWDEDFLDRKSQIKREMKETLMLADLNFSEWFDVKTASMGNKKP
jgi:hypothetical protein